MSDPAAVPGGAAEVPLDDVMLAMDVVDTLRRRERLVARELDELGRAEDLKERLQRIYAQQGIEVPDHVIEQGVAALREDRFTYRPVADGLARRLALAYVGRGRWGKWLGGTVAALLLALGINHFAFVAPDRALPERLAQQHEAVLALAGTDAARQAAGRLFAAATAALDNDDSAAAKTSLAQLEQMQRILQQEYVIQVVNRPGERSGVWRIPDVNQEARNYYVIVEAVDPTGRHLQVPVRSEETGRTETVASWGLRVDEATFERVRQDKLDDGIIQNDRFGSKPRGRLEPRFDQPTSGGAITSW